MNKTSAHARQIVMALLSAALPLAAMAAAVPAFGQPPADLIELSLAQLMEIRNEKVFGASKHEEEIARSPVAVGMVPASEMERLGHRGRNSPLKATGRC